VIRFAWVALVVAVATAGYGLIAIGASLLGRRGDIYFWCTQQWGRAVVRASGAPVVPIGMDRIDWSAPHVLVANHISAYDIVALASVLPVPFFFVGKKELNRVPLFGTAWRAAGHVSIDRSNRNRAIASLKQAGARIRHGRGVIIVFPEGTRSRTGSLQAFKKGAFIMAADAALPLIPTMIIGSDRIQPRGTYRVHPGPIEIRFAEPVDAAEFGPERVDDLTEAVRARMLDMIPSERA
jgi:1-acyl-sn-glycerol-3-phosphate acyltransferase